MPTGPLAQLSIREFLSQLASDAPTPGGGSVAALVGALSAGLGRMACRLTAGKPKFAAVETDVRQLAGRLARAEQMFCQLMDEDAAAYGVLSEALRLERSDPARPKRVREAATLAAEVPTQTAALGHRVRIDLQKLAGICNPRLESDVECGMHLARAATQAAIQNVRVNLRLLPAADAAALERELEPLLSD